jgi:lipopolysaccharide/colanic/teichoic acid biosynthesis glycosyltransferase
VKQVRIIDGGRPFRMFKFRSMGDAADSMLPELAAQHGGNEVLFKKRWEPAGDLRGPDME